MPLIDVRFSRRAVLTASAGAGLTALSVLGMAAPEVHAATPDHGLAQRLRALETEHGARLGVYALDTATGRTVTYRAGERFPICSVFKALAAAAVLRDLDHGGDVLARRIRYDAALVRRSGYSPVTSRAENLAEGMTVSELCAAAVSESDNTAGNLLLRLLNGPTGITRFCRSLGDGTTRLDRWEPELNSAEPWRKTDTTSPAALGGTFGRLLLGDALCPEDRRLLTDWLVANTTNGERFRKALPTDWVLADKTGGGDDYGVANDVGVVWPPKRQPLLLSLLSTTHDPAGPSDDLLVADATRMVADALS
ncbi:class A beta-lactamase [Streptomyces sp. 6N106]|uniref:class A beta-lactamase n=1 Tax=Streptomyces sp. 6N106 TaxID=3457418 RepID=UPI003FD23A96